jgi:hypothetical protein
MLVFQFLSYKFKQTLRFRIEFNFRDAKQYFGLEDFMNTTKKASGKCGKSSVYASQCECKTAKNRRRKVSWNRRPENALSRSKIRDGSNKNSSRKSRNNFNERDH